MRRKGQGGGVGSRQRSNRDRNGNGGGGGDAPWRLFGTEAQLNQSGVLGALHKPLT